MGRADNSLRPLNINHVERLALIAILERGVKDETGSNDDFDFKYMSIDAGLPLLEHLLEKLKDVSARERPVPISKPKSKKSV